MEVSVVAATAKSLTFSGASATTVMAAVSLSPSLVAAIRATPDVNPVTSPASSTVATSGLSLVQVTARLVGPAPLDPAPPP